MNTDKKILLFNLPVFTVLQISEIMNPLDIEVMPVPKAQFHMPLDVILGINPPTASQPPKDETLDEPVLIMYGMSNEDIDNVLHSLRSSSIKISLKAIVTPTNISWNVYRLSEHLKADRAHIAGK